MAMRVSGLYSGMDTESIIADLVAVRQTKVDKIKKSQTKHEWKQESWKNLNSKVYKLFSGTLDNLSYQSSYAKKTTKVSNPNAATVITSDSAMKSVQSLKINKLATSGYLTGGKLEKADGTEVTKDTTMGELLGLAEGGSTTINVAIGGGKAKAIELTADMKLSDFAGKLQELGLNANFDEATDRLFIGASASGTAKDFSITGDAAALLKLTEKPGAKKLAVEDAEIELNGAIFTSNTNTFEINGLTISCNAVTGDNAITLTTEDDVSGVYDMIKKFIKEYTALINEMDKLYYTKPKKGFEP